MSRRGSIPVSAQGDMAMHDKKDNPHFHTMITMRDIDPEAKHGFGKKNRKWNRKDLVDTWRHNYEECINKHLALTANLSYHVTS
jgi:N-acyl-D-aspartate/D-glutamate deacylase